MNKVIHGDCLYELQNIPTKSIDMILCDLPYSVTRNAWDAIIPFEPLWEQYERVIKDEGAIVLTAAQPFTSALVMSNPKLFRYEWIWEKDKGTGFLNAKKMPLRCHESVLIFYKKSPVYNPQKTYGHEEQHTSYKQTKSRNYGHYKGVITDSKKTWRYPRTVVKINTVNNNGSEKVNHSTQKPISLFEYLIRTYTNENMTVLDNAAGSGTTAIACMNTNRNYILIEKEQEYIDIIHKRIEAHKAVLYGNE